MGIMSGIAIPEIYLAEILEQAEREYPNECCGMLLGSSAKPGEISRRRPCRNVQDDYHARDPKNFPRTAGTAYFLEPKELLAIQKEMRERKEAIRVIYHSHIDAGAYFSEEDARIALADGSPAYPGMEYLVVSVMKGKARGWKLFCWDEIKKEFGIA